MTLKASVSLIAGKLVLLVSRALNIGYGGTWPGEIMLRIYPGVLSFLSRQIKKGVILVAGTNGKTTTSLMIKSVLESQSFKVIHNRSGANLDNGLVSSFIGEMPLWRKKIFDYAVFEVDENTLPIILNQITPDILICLNLFRDQLDRYGEVDTIAEKWHQAITRLPKTSTVILNSDDHQIAFLGRHLAAKTLYFGIDEPALFEKEKEHATDSLFCLNCQNRLDFTGFYYSHIGVWHCPTCGLNRPKPDFSQPVNTLPGLYNRYNSLAAIASLKTLKVSQEKINKELKTFSPAFGRQEEFKLKGKMVKVFLSKNPAGFNESIKTVLELGATTLLIVLNDRIPDGRDVSWIWDVDFERIPLRKKIVVSGDRVYDLALRLNYASKEKLIIKGVLKKALHEALRATPAKGTLFCLPTYSAMLELRKILTGKKIL